MDRRKFMGSVAASGMLSLAPNAKDATASPSIVRPTARAIEWADAEIGVLIHYDLTVFEPEYKWRQNWDYNPDPAVFNPSKLDTDQWLSAAKDLGAKYAVLVAKHCTGFSLWPTRAHDYSVKSSPWKGGQGDLVADFIASCEKYSLKPGLYYSAASNGYFKVDNPGLVITGDKKAQARYNQIVVNQLTELWSEYGDLFEIWFDGGVLPPEEGGPQILDLLDLQPEAVYFQGPAAAKNLIRWSGNERGVAPYPNWSTAHSTTASNGTIEIDNLHGEPNGAVWCPAEADLPNRWMTSFQGGWFWKEGQDHFVKSADHLVDCYYKSVGRNANMMLGMVIDDRGLAPEPDVKVMREFGTKIKRRFEKPLAQSSGTGNVHEIELNKLALVTDVEIMEDIAHGQRVLSYEVHGHNGLFWIPLGKGSSIGHKRLQKILPGRYGKLRLTIKDSLATPHVKRFCCYNCQ